nr:dTDP-4-dehydrorhamnose 3,5-epimerase [Aerococcus mictus]
MLDVTGTAIDGVKVLRPRRFGDNRGLFFESYNAERWRGAGIDITFVQDNDSYSKDKGTVRGLHFQTPPFAQSKLVRVIRGAVLDVVVDIRKGSPTYGRHVAVELSAEGGDQLFVPRGFAHGFCTLEPETYVIYKVDAHYSPAHDAGIQWNDPAPGIDWPVKPEAAILTAKDLVHPPFADIVSPFEF